MRRTVLRPLRRTVLCNRAENDFSQLPCHVLIQSISSIQSRPVVRLWWDLPSLPPLPVTPGLHTVRVRPAERQRGLQHHRPGAHGRLWRPAPRSHWHRELPQGGGNNIWLWILVWKWKHRSHCRTVSMKSLMSSWSLVVLADNGRIGEEPEEYLHSRKCAVQVGLGLCSACPICSSLPSQPGQSDRSTCLISLSTHLISSNLVIHIYYNYMDWIFQLSSLSSW